MAQHYFLQKLYSSSRPNESINKLNTTRRFDTLMHVIYKTPLWHFAKNTRNRLVHGYIIIAYKTSIQIPGNLRITINFYELSLYMVKKFLYYV